jgi:hypothetical protein
MTLSTTWAWPNFFGYSQEIRQQPPTALDNGAVIEGALSMCAERNDAMLRPFR